MKTDRRSFLKSAGLLTAAATVINPVDIFASAQKGKKAAGSKKMELTWIPYDAKMKHTFTIANSSRTHTPLVLTKITYDGYEGYGEASMPPYLG